MSRLTAGGRYGRRYVRPSLTAAMRMAGAVVLATVSVSWSQDALTATLHPSGMVRVARAGVELAMIELNAHGTEWKHAPQEGAAAEVSDLPDQAGKQFVGALAIPNTEDGAIRYTESVRTLSQGLHIEYELTMTKTMKLSGLQVSVNFPVAQYAGKEVLISRPQDDDPQLVGLPKEQQEGKFQLWSGQGATVEVAKGTVEAVTIELRAETDVLVQDLRQWEHSIFEVRFPAIMEAGGRGVSAGDRFHLDLTVTFAGPVELVGP